MLGIGYYFSFDSVCVCGLRFGGYQLGIRKVLCSSNEFYGCSSLCYRRESLYFGFGSLWKIKWKECSEIINGGNVNAKIWKRRIVEDILEIFNHLQYSLLKKKTNIEGNCVAMGNNCSE